ncbi:winged helix-turn-helix domain-containing tetratricopeptide repeat protein [Haloechinothrix halophila]|uniref:winged helix-turn-helix domain-containing tetratricopeptide repeat protein n=1 Tax=Haloechinothrix halophila TaxID=1069073 RepID=UPI00146FBF48|nr:winged helix-turn-helix domain-containing protein [Haloechinothrix halophila]
MLYFGDCVLDRGRFELRRAGEVVPIEPRALRVLLHLIDHRDRAVPKEELLDSVWGSRFVSESALSAQIKGARRAIGDTGRGQRMVKTVHGQGYMFVAPVSDEAAAQDTDPSAPEGPDHTTVAASAARDRPVVAVLPFTNLTPATGHRHVARGLTHDVIAALSKHRWLRVLTAAATAGLSDDPDVVQRLHDELGARYAVDGTIRLDGQRLRVTASLTDTAAGVCLWADRFDREFKDLFDVLDELTDMIVATVEPELGYAERGRSSRTPRPDLRTWDLFHLGVDRFFRFTSEGNHQAQRMLHRCRELDPDFPDAHAWWAYAVVLGMVYWDTDPKPDLLDNALDATRIALRADDQNALFHVLYGRVQLARREYQAALRANARAIELNPTFAAAYCGLGDSLCYEGRYTEAIARFERSVALGAHDPQLWAFLTYGALALLFAQRYEEAIDWTEQAASIPNCQYWTTSHRLVALAHAGHARQASATVPALLEQCPMFSIDYAERKLFYLKRPEQRALYLDGLHAAGVPEQS